MDNTDRIVICAGGGFIGGHLGAGLVCRGHRPLRSLDFRPPEQGRQRFRKTHDLHLDLQKPASNAAAAGSARVACHLKVANRERLERRRRASSAFVNNADKRRDPEVTASKNQQEDASPTVPGDAGGRRSRFNERRGRPSRGDFGRLRRGFCFQSFPGPGGSVPQGVH